MQHALGHLSFVFLDHDKDCYAADLKKLLSMGALAPHCRVVADNVLFPGAPGYLQLVEFEFEFAPTSAIEPPVPAEAFTGQQSRPRTWRTEVKRMPFERKGFETEFKEVEDGMSISVRL
jgi:predicted O-methyltransferase YrrM